LKVLIEKEMSQRKAAAKRLLKYSETPFEAIDISKAPTAPKWCTRAFRNNRYHLTINDNAMTNSPQLKLNFSGEELKTIGQNLALETADKLHEDWTLKAMAMLRQYCRIHGSGHQFRGEQARFYCEANDIPQPGTKKAYGGLMAKLAKEGLIKRVGFSNTKDPKSHHAHCALWEVV